MPLAIADGGTGATNAADARTNLGLGTIATQNSNNVTITGGSLSGVSVSSSSFQNGTNQYITNISGDTWITNNAYWDGTNWQRVDTSKWASAINILINTSIPGETNTAGVVFWRAAAGSNPISSTYGSAGGWNNSFLTTQYGDVVVGGYGIEIDGNGTLPYGRVINYSSGNTAPKLRGILTNNFVDFSGVDDSAQPSWYFGNYDDTFKVMRAAAGSTGVNNFSSLVAVSSTGSVTLATPLPVASGGTGISAAPKVRVYCNTNQSIANATATKVQFDTETFDTNNNFDPTTNYRFTPTIAGKYHVHAQIQIATAISIAYLLIIYIYKNGNIISTARKVINNFTSALDEVVQISDLIDMNGSTDYLEIYIYQGAGANKAITGGSTNTYASYSLAL